MDLQWIAIPAEIRTMIYREFFRSLWVTLHPYLESWDDSDSEAEDAEDTDVDDDKDNSAIAQEESDAGSPDIEHPQQDFESLLLTCKHIREHAEPLLFSEASFTINNCCGHYIDHPGFEIDSRIRNLEIVQEEDVGLWPNTIAFLERHFKQDGAVLNCLALPGESFDIYTDDDEIATILEIALPRVKRLSFSFLVVGEIEVVDTMTNIESIILMSYKCPVTIVDGIDITVRAANQWDCDEVEDALRQAYRFDDSARFNLIIDSGLGG